MPASRCCSGRIVTGCRFHRLEVGGQRVGHLLSESYFSSSGESVPHLLSFIDRFSPRCYSTVTPSSTANNRRSFYARNDAEMSAGGRTIDGAGHHQPNRTPIDNAVAGMLAQMEVFDVVVAMGRSAAAGGAGPSSSSGGGSLQHLQGLVDRNPKAAMGAALLLAKAGQARDAREVLSVVAQVARRQAPATLNDGHDQHLHGGHPNGTTFAADEGRTEEAATDEMEKIMSNSNEEGGKEATMIHVLLNLARLDVVTLLPGEWSVDRDALVSDIRIAPVVHHTLNALISNSEPTGSDGTRTSQHREIHLAGPSLYAGGRKVGMHQPPTTLNDLRQLIVRAKAAGVTDVEAANRALERHGDSARRSGGGQRIEHSHRGAVADGSSIAPRGNSGRRPGRDTHHPAGLTAAQHVLALHEQAARNPRWKGTAAHNRLLDTLLRQGRTYINEAFMAHLHAAWVKATNGADGASQSAGNTAPQLGPTAQHSEPMASRMMSCYKLSHDGVVVSAIVGGIVAHAEQRNPRGFQTEAAESTMSFLVDDIVSVDTIHRKAVFKTLDEVLMGSKGTHPCLLLPLIDPILAYAVQRDLWVVDKGVFRHLVGVLLFLLSTPEMESGIAVPPPLVTLSLIAMNKLAVGKKSYSSSSTHQEAGGAADATTQRLDLLHRVEALVMATTVAEKRRAVVGVYNWVEKGVVGEFHPAMYVRLGEGLLAAAEPSDVAVLAARKGADAEPLLREVPQSTVGNYALEIMDGVLQDYLTPRHIAIPHRAIYMYLELFRSGALQELGRRVTQTNDGSYVESAGNASWERGIAILEHLLPHAAQPERTVQSAINDVCECIATHTTSWVTALQAYSLCCDPTSHAGLRNTLAAIAARHSYAGSAYDIPIGGVQPLGGVGMRRGDAAKTSVVPRYHVASTLIGTLLRRDINKLVRECAGTDVVRPRTRDEFTKSAVRSSTSAASTVTNSEALAQTAQYAYEHGIGQPIPVLWKEALSVLKHQLSTTRAHIPHYGERLRVVGVLLWSYTRAFFPYRAFAWNAERYRISREKNFADAEDGDSIARWETGWDSDEAEHANNRSPHRPPPPKLITTAYTTWQLAITAFVSITENEIASMPPIGEYLQTATRSDSRDISPKALKDVLSRVGKDRLVLEGAAGQILGNSSQYTDRFMRAHVLQYIVGLMYTRHRTAQKTNAVVAAGRGGGARKKTEQDMVAHEVVEHAARASMNGTLRAFLERYGNHCAAITTDINELQLYYRTISDASSSNEDTTVMSRGCEMLQDSWQEVLRRNPDVGGLAAELFAMESDDGDK